MYDMDRFQSTGTFERLRPLLPLFAGARLPFGTRVSGDRSGVREAFARHGFSHEFAGHREYVPGDDLRYLDWKAFARSDRYNLKRFHDETNARAVLLLDASPGMEYRGETEERPSKIDYARAILGIMAWILLREGLEIELRSFATGLSPVLARGNSLVSWESIVRKLDEIVPVRKSSEKDSCAFFPQLGSSLRAKTLPIIAGDLMFDEPANIISGLRVLCARSYSPVLVHVLDPDEIEFPFRERTRFEAFGSDRFHDVEAQRIGDEYRAEMRRFLDFFYQAARAEGIAYKRITSDRPLLDILRSDH